MIRRLFIRCNNAFVRRRRLQVAASEILLLVPHCLQFSRCPHNIVHDIGQCRQCGQCMIGALRELCAERGAPFKVASGGREAVGRVRQPDIKVVVAVACDKELVEGILGAFPKPVLAVPNQQPRGPCKDTTVDLAPVREALLSVLRPPAADASA